MSDTRDLQKLQQISQREINSLMQYLAGAFPWTRGQSEARDRLMDMIDDERVALAKLTRYLYRNKMPPPFTGGYPTEFTTLNFIDLDYLVPLLARHEEESIAQMQADLATVEAGEGKQIAEALLALKKKHQAELSELLKPEPAVMS
jgi:hypothetical protein